MHEPPHTGRFSIEVPGNPVRAYWFWTGRSVNSPVGDDTLIVAIDNSDGVTEAELRAQEVHSAEDRIYTWHTNGFRDEALDYVTSGTNTYDVSGFSIDNNARYNHGVGTAVIYESTACPYAQIKGWSGLDSFHWTRKGELGPDSNVVCDVFPASNSSRTLSFNLAIGGVASSDRGNSIWYITGKGQQPTLVVPDANGLPNPSATEVFDPLNGVPGREWDFSGSELLIPAGDTFACVQIESPEDDDGISAVWAGLITSMPLDPPSISIQKVVEPSMIQSGESVTFTVKLTNTGAITLTNVVISDQLAPDCERSYLLLPIGSSETYICTTTNVTKSFTNTIEIIGLTPDGFAVQDRDDASVTLLQMPTPTPTAPPTSIPTSIPEPTPTATAGPSPTPAFAPAVTLGKLPTEQTTVAGDSAKFTIRVENSGNVALTNIVIVDELAPQCGKTYSALAVGQVEEYECQMENVLNDLTNVATVNAEVADGSSISASADAEIIVITSVPTPIVPTPIVPTPITSGAIGDYVWFDQNVNGLQDDGEAGLADVEVSLFTSSDEFITSTVTTADGSYLFTDVLPDTYYVEFTTPNEYGFTINDQSNAERNSNPDPETGKTDPIQISNGEQNLTIDAGLVGTPSLLLSKTDSGDVGQPGGVIAYTLVVTNTGNTTALDVVIVEFVPDNTTYFAESSASAWICETKSLGDEQCILDVGDLAPNGTFQTKFAVKINSPLPLSVSVINNQATVSSTNGLSGRQAVTEITPLRPTHLPSTGEPFNSQFFFIPLIQ